MKGLLKELYQQLKEQGDITFDRGDEEPVDVNVGDDAAMAGDQDSGDEFSFDTGEEGGGAFGEQDEIDRLTFDVPTLIRVMEWAREEVQSDEELHDFTERLLALDVDVITMEDYDAIMSEMSGGEEGDDFGGDDESGEEGDDQEFQSADERPDSNPDNIPNTDGVGMGA